MWSYIRRFVGCNYKDRPGARKLETLLLECGAQVILQMLALEMMEKKEARVERGEIV